MTYVVEVSEPKVFTYTGSNVAWWLLYRQRHEGTGRLTEHGATLVGSLVDVACDDKDHAEWLAAHMVNHGGLHASAVRVKKATATPGPSRG